MGRVPSVLSCGVQSGCSRELGSGQRRPRQEQRLRHPIPCVRPRGEARLAGAAGSTAGLRRGSRRAGRSAERPGVGEGRLGSGSTRPFCCDRLRRPRASSSGRIRPQRPHEAASGRIRPVSSPAAFSLDLAANGRVSPLLRQSGTRRQGREPTPSRQASRNLMLVTSRTGAVGGRSRLPSQPRAAPHRAYLADSIQVTQRRSCSSISSWVKWQRRPWPGRIHSKRKCCSRRVEAMSSPQSYQQASRKP